MAGNTSPLVPTYHGHINSTIDALILFEATLSGQLNHVPRRPHDRERQDLIKSGNVFIYEEHASGIKRWTDGVSWSPSRILGNFLIYRELEKPFPPGEKKRALKKSKKLQQGISKVDTSRTSAMSFSGSLDPDAIAKDSERALIGSLVDSYPFKEGGLVKKTISVSIRGIPHHLVSYYTIEDVQGQQLITPSLHLELRPVLPRHELITSQNFRAPVEEGDPSAGNDRIRHAYMQNPAQCMPPPTGSILQRALSLPSFTHPPLGGQYIGQQSFAYAAHPAHPHMGHPQHAHQQHAHQQHAHQQHAHQHPHHNPFVSMAPSTSPMPYPVASAGNYSLEPSRSRFTTSSTPISQEFPRAMPTDNSPRRHSNFEAPQATVLGSMAMQPVGAEARGMPATSYHHMQANHYYATSRPTHLNTNGHALDGSHHEHDYSQELRAKIEMDDDNDEDDDSSSPQYALGDPSPWAFNGLAGAPNHHGLDGSQNHHNMDGNQNGQAMDGSQNHHSVDGQNGQTMDDSQNGHTLDGSQNHHMLDGTQNPQQYYNADGTPASSQWQNGNH